MADDTTLIGAPQPDGSVDGGDGQEQPARKMIPVPADKFRELNREVSRLRAESRQNALNDRSGGVPVNPEQQAAVDLISDTVSRRVATEFSSIQDQLDDMSLGRGIGRVLEDPNAALYESEFREELRQLANDNPKSRMDDLVSRAETQAIARAYRAGKLTDSIREEEAETARVKSTLSVPRTSAASTGRGEAPKPLDQMTAEELAASGRIDEYFQMRTGRQPRRR